MSNPEQPLPAGGKGREVVALIEIEHTTVSPFVVRLLMVFFLTAIAVVPIAEVAIARVRPDESIAAAWTHLSNIPGEVRTSLDHAPESSLWQRIVSTNRVALTGLSAFDRALENESFIGRTLRPPAQLLMTGWLGAGNERVYPGHDGWVFYRQDVEYITGPGFLDPARIGRRIAAAPEWTDPPHPDPREAILQFKRDLDARGITLVVMPMPLKPGVHPEMLVRRYTDVTGVLQNRSYRAFVDDLRRNGVLVFDPSDALAAARGSGPQYLATDTHWRPETMEAVAGLAGDFILTQAALPAAKDPGYRIERVEVRSRGDIARMLDLPEHSVLFPPESVWLRRVLQHGSAWRSSRDADVLLLGDSFSNIYSLESMGWGTSAGLAEQLSYSLRRPLDRLTQNDQGSFATRAMLQSDPSRLDGKRVVIYQFAVRELADGDWKVLRIPNR
jgi:hypothetical protein